MTTKKLVWRLKEQPTTESLRELVKDGVLSKEEAREILFSSETEEERDKKSLESEIKFLRELVDKLSNRNETIKIIETIKPRYHHYPWYNPYVTWCVGYPTTNSGNSVTYTANSSFANIKTF